MTEKPISYMPTREQSDIFCHWLGDVDKLIKLLKIKAFILEKFLDTAFRRPIRFRQKVLMVFFETPLELFSLEREGRPVAGRPFCRFSPLCLRALPGLQRSCSCGSGLSPQHTNPGG